MDDLALLSSVAFAVGMLCGWWICEAVCRLLGVEK